MAENKEDKDADNNILPKSLTHKMKLYNLYDIYDYQLIDHIVMNDNIYGSNCDCFHNHSKIKCNLHNDVKCSKCKSYNTLFLEKEVFYFHPEFFNKKECNNINLFKCCPHIHEPPCKNCLNCKIGISCIVKSSFVCYYTESSVCLNHPENKITYCEYIEASSKIKYHLYNIKNPNFFFCKKHKHYHNNFPSIPCCIHSEPCCDNSLEVNKLKFCFTIKINNGKLESFIIIDPSLWKDQSENYFRSFIRSILENKHFDIKKSRYKKFEKSKFNSPVLDTHKSGKMSEIRTNVTGYTAMGLYLTSGIICTMNHNLIMLPQKIMKELKKHIDTDLLIVKRDPVITPTGVAVLKTIVNPDPECEISYIPDMRSLPYKQDQDGDKNGIHGLPKYIKEYDFSHTALYKIAKMEMMKAYVNLQTNIGLPRVEFSEHNKLNLYRNKDYYTKKSPEFFGRCVNRGIRFFNEAFCGYLKEEGHAFEQILIHENSKPNVFNLITIQDVLGETNYFNDIVDSGTKGTKENINIYMNNLYKIPTFENWMQQILFQRNRYTNSSKELSLHGKNLFKLIYSYNDCVFNFTVFFFNKIAIADFFNAPELCMCLCYSETSLILAYEDLMSLIIDDV